MARIRNEKDYKAKKYQIVKHAINLLDELGYEDFSINKVIQTSGMTKGAFFHYFGSKKELVSEIVNQILIPMVEGFELVSKDTSLEPKEKIKKLFDVGAKSKGVEKRTTQQLIRLLQKNENREIMNMITDHSIEILTPIYEKIMIEGNNLGHFNIQYPNGVAFMFLTMIAAINKEIGAVLYKEDVDEKQYSKLRNKLNAFELYAKELFQFEKDTNLFDENLLNINLKK